MKKSLAPYLLWGFLALAFVLGQRRVARSLIECAGKRGFEPGRDPANG